MNLMDNMVCLMDPMKDMVAYLILLMVYLRDRMGYLTIPMEDMDTVMDIITDSSLTFLVCVGSCYKCHDTVFQTSVKPGPLEKVCIIWKLNVTCIYAKCVNSYLLY